MQTEKPVLSAGAVPQKSTTTAILPKEERCVEYVPFGGTEPLKLTIRHVQKFIAVPTRSGAMPSEKQCVEFIMKCQAKRANPFDGDIYMIGFDTKDGPMFNIVCGIEMFLKRAEASPEFDGLESGIVVRTEDGAVEERVGSLLFDNEQLLGGWCRVYRKDRTKPFVKRVNLSPYNSGRSRWGVDAPGMIEKVAICQALRLAFPQSLGGLYAQEEMPAPMERGPERRPLFNTKPTAALPNGGDDNGHEATASAATQPEAAPTPIDPGVAKFTEAVKKHGITMTELLSALRELGTIDDSVEAIEQMDTKMRDAVLKQLPNIAERIKADATLV
jgi:phage recombination protein Bet